MYAERHTIALVTAADGSCTAYSEAVVTGSVLSVQYVKTDFADGVDITVSLESTGETLLTLTNQNIAAVFYPRVQVHDETGVGATTDGTRKLREPMLAVFDRVKVVVAAGGDTKTGAIRIVTG